MGVAVVTVTIFVSCVLCCGLSLHGHGRAESRATWTVNEYSLTKATPLNVFSAVFYLSHLGGGCFRVFWFWFCLVFFYGQHFSHVNKYSSTAGKQYLFLQLCLCAAEIETEERNGFCLSPKCRIITTNSNASKATRILIHL